MNGKTGVSIKEALSCFPYILLDKYQKSPNKMMSFLPQQKWQCIIHKQPIYQELFHLNWG